MLKNNWTSIKINIMKSKILFLLLGILIVSCNVNNEKTAREVYTANRLKAITTAYNKKAATMEILYGNDVALNNLIGRPDTKANGAIYKLITWKQHPDPNWHYVNGNEEVLSVETVTITNITNYNVEEQQPHAKTNTEVNDRISYITGLRPAVMP